MTDEERWHEDRRQGIGGSDASVIMNVSPWSTEWILWAQKVGKLPPAPATPAMARGTRLEPIARAQYNAASGQHMEPVRLVHPEHPWMIGNLDGMNGSGILEVKCPGAEAHGYALRGEVPPYYIPQVQHYLAVSGAAWCDYYSFDGVNGVTVRVLPDPAYIADLIAREQAFWHRVVFDDPPPLSDRDTLIREDDEWLQAARIYRDYEARVVEATRQKEAAKELLLKLRGKYPRVQGGGVLLTEYEVKGSIDNKRVYAELLKGVDLEKYRGPTRTQVRVTVQDELQGLDGKVA